MRNKINSKDELREVAREFIGLYIDEMAALYDATNDAPRECYNKQAVAIFKRELADMLGGLE